MTHCADLRIKIIELVYKIYHNLCSKYYIPDEENLTNSLFERENAFGSSKGDKCMYLFSIVHCYSDALLKFFKILLPSRGYFFLFLSRRENNEKAKTIVFLVLLIPLNILKLNEVMLLYFFNF